MNWSTEKLQVDLLNTIIRFPWQYIALTSNVSGSAADVGIMTPSSLLPIVVVVVVVVAAAAAAAAMCL